MTDSVAIVNGRVFAASEEAGPAQAVGIRGDRIAAVGTVLPGFVDPHNHFLATGESMASLDVRFPGVQSVADLIRAVGRAIPALAAGTTLHAHGYDDAKYERPPTSADIDAVAPANPVLIGHVSGHYALANSAAIRASHVGPETPDPPGGRIDRDAAGRPTGVFRDAAMGLVQRTAVDIGHHGPNFHTAAEPSALVDAVERAGRAFVEAGLTTVCDAQVTCRELAAYQSARSEGRLLLRTVCMPLSHHLEDYDAVGLHGPFGDEWLSLGAMKFYCDGSLIGGTAAFSRPYGRDGELEGSLFWEPDELRLAIGRAHRSGWQVGVHAQGDRAIGIVLDAFGEAVRSFPRPDPRFRLEHAGYPSTRQLGQMRDLGVVAVCQPSYLTDSGDDFLARLGDRAYGLQPLHTALELGVHVALSSDSDVASYRPLDTIAAAVQRRTSSGAVIGPEERLTVEQAVLAHTREAAYALRAESVLGTLQPGQLADVAVVGGDLFACDPAGIAELPVLLTVIGGRVVHDGT
ncbi:MAG: amidohydrolase [Acidimicrobiales bacterium]